MLLFLQTLHAICDLGTLIAKRLSQDQMNVSETQAVPLPAQLYTPLQDNQNENSVVCSAKKASTKCLIVRLNNKAFILFFIIFLLLISCLILFRRAMRKYGWDVRKYLPILRL
jgi:hypothetical protein